MTAGRPPRVLVDATSVPADRGGVGRYVDGLDATARDLSNRAKGTAAELRSRFRKEVVDDTILQERVRSAIGHAVSHPGAIEVTVSDGRVTLQGSVLDVIADRLLGRRAGDRLQDNQLRWIDYCSTHGMPVSVCYLQWEAAA